ncbi:MAG: type I 3-dehydroquinate dehydratase [Spirochaetes bacterium]|nr:type I 3-dehydroquinate dehydratase [Spirochaetota bacterium]
MICISIADVTIDEALNIIQSNELSEVRLDRLVFNKDDISKLFSAKNSTIVTYRPTEVVTESERKKWLIAAINAGAQYVDIEVESSDDFKNDITRTAKSKGCKIIVSYHDYNKTPLINELEEIIKWCFDSKCDIAKICCYANSYEECARLLSLYGYGDSIISIGMGNMGKITRIASLLLGAAFTYASIDDRKKTAPGQIDSRKLKEILEMIKAL